MCVGAITVRIALSCFSVECEVTGRRLLVPDIQRIKAVTAGYYDVVSLRVCKGGAAVRLRSYHYLICI